MTGTSRLWLGLAFATLIAICVGIAPTRALAQAAGTTTAASPPAGKVDGIYGAHFTLKATDSLPPDYSKDGHSIDSLIDILHYFMGILFVGWGIFFVFCLVKFRQRPGHTAVYEPIKAKPSKYTEIAVIVFEAFLLIGLSIPIWGSVKARPANEQGAMHVRVVAEQFAWNFHYPGADGKFGRTGVQFIDLATNPVGKDPSDPNGKDDIVSGEFHMPVNKPIIVDITSKDVIHSFSIPVLRVKQDAIPGMRIPVGFEAVREGRYQVACAQLCGNNHYKMLSPMVIESEQAFQKWMEEKSKPPEEFTGD